MPTLTIDNFGGPLTRRNTGDINSGLTKFETSWGYDPYSKPGNLTWMERPTSILTWTGSQGPMMAMKQRTESDVNLIYGWAKNNSLYRITVNSSSNPDVDSPSVIGTVSPGAIDRGADITFYGTTEKIFISGDTNIEKVNFDGSSPSVIGTFATANPRPLATFLGRIYFGNGNNIGEIDSTETVTTVAKLSPALPSGLVVRDLDVTPDGNYLEMIASRTSAAYPAGDSNDRTSSGAADSFKFYWNGIDDAASASENYPGLVLSSNVVHAGKDHTFGYDSNGAALFEEGRKMISFRGAVAPHPKAAFSIGNILSFATAEYEQSSDRFRTAIFQYGQYDEESPKGLFRLLRQNAPIRDDIISVSAAVNVSNQLYAPQFFDYPNNISGTGKMYYSTQEDVADGATALVQKLYRFYTSPTGTSSIVAGVYETQTQLFSKKVAPKEVRLYTEPLVSGNDFVVDLIGSGGSVISGGSQRFIVGTSSIATGTDMVHFNPAIAPTYAIGARITNSSITGVVNWTGTKLEIDYEPSGK